MLEHPFKMKAGRIFALVGLAGVLLSAASCALPSTPAAPTPLAGNPSAAPTQPAVSPTAAAQPTQSVGQIMPTETPSHALGLALQQADAEMKAAQRSTTLPDARRHAEAVVNILVGRWSTWYGDADGDGQINDPSDGAGVLPGDRIPGPAPDTRGAASPIGLAIIVFDGGDPTAQEAVRQMVGDVDRWKDDLRGAYLEIARSVDSSDANRQSVNKLSGRVPRALAWARLILVKAPTVADANRFAAMGQQETQASLDLTQSMR